VRRPLAGRLRVGRDAEPAGRCDRGTVTAELAVAFVAVGFLLSVAMGAVGVAVSQLACVDAARAGARLAARSEVTGAVGMSAEIRAPAGATVTVERSGRTVRVTVQTLVRLVAPLPPVAVSATAVASVEGLS
jgi:hypothetical protein